MAKRARGNVRPGQRRPNSRRPGSPTTAGTPTAAPTPRPTGLSEAEVARAAELETQLLAQEREAEQARSRTRARAANRDLAGPVTGSLAAAATNEYAYVARDVKDIVRIASLLITILIVLWVLIDVMKLIPIGG
jgi:hypothetical protein